MLVFIQLSTAHNKLFVKVFIVTSFSTKIAPKIMAYKPLQVAHCV